MVTSFFKVSLLHPSSPVMASFTSYTPGVEYKCAGGFRSVLLDPSPKFQYQDWIGAKETELSMKLMDFPRHTELFGALVVKAGFNAVQNCCRFMAPPVAAENPQYTLGSLLKIVPIRSTWASTRKWSSK